MNVFTAHEFSCIALSEQTDDRSLPLMLQVDLSKLVVFFSSSSSSSSFFCFVFVFVFLFFLFNQTRAKFFINLQDSFFRIYPVCTEVSQSYHLGEPKFPHGLHLVIFPQQFLGSAKQTLH